MAEFKLRSDACFAPAKGCSRIAKRSPFRKLLFCATLILIVLVLIPATILFLTSSKPQTAILPDGTVIQFLGVTRGTNPIVTGSSIEKLLGNLIPARGLRFFSINLQRPRELASAGTHAPLTAWIYVTNAPRQMDHNYRNWFKSIASNSSGRQFENDPERRVFTHSGTELLMAFPLFAFPRDEPTVHLSISPSPKRWTSEERQWAEFEFKNPFRPVPARWNASPLPITNRIEGHEFILAKVGPPRRPSFSFVQPVLEFTFRRPSPEWHLISCSITDDEGNTYVSSGWGGRTNEPALNVTFTHSLETNRPWKVTASFAAGGSNLFNPGPLAPTDHHFLQLFVDGPFVSFTNKAGIPIRSWLSLRLLHVRPETRTERPYFVLLGASNQLAAPVGFNPFPHFDPSRHVSLMWDIPRYNTGPSPFIGNPPPLPTGLSVHLAVPKTIETAFYFDPSTSRLSP